MLCTDVSLYQPCNFPKAASDSRRNKTGSELIPIRGRRPEREARLEARNGIIRAQSQTDALKKPKRLFGGWLERDVSSLPRPLSP